jgi:hypothetical protein
VSPDEVLQHGRRVNHQNFQGVAPRPVERVRRHGPVDGLGRVALLRQVDGAGGATPLDEDYPAKPAYGALVDALREERPRGGPGT